jgi:histidyl-tRNA synthetase
VFGESEAERGAVIFRDMTAGVQEELPKEEAIRRLLRSRDNKED